jgi:hypothetical protein
MNYFGSKGDTIKYLQENGGKSGMLGLIKMN